MQAWSREKKEQILSIENMDEKSIRKQKNRARMAGSLVNNFRWCSMNGRGALAYK